MRLVIVGLGRGILEVEMLVDGEELMVGGGE